MYQQKYKLLLISIKERIIINKKIILNLLC